MVWIYFPWKYFKEDSAIEQAWVTLWEQYSLKLMQTTVKLPLTGIVNLQQWVKNSCFKVNIEYSFGIFPFEMLLHPAH